MFYCVHGKKKQVRMYAVLDENMFGLVQFCVIVSVR